MIDQYFIFAALLGMLLLFSLIISEKSKWIILSSAIYLSTMSFSDKEGFDNTLIAPLEALRGASRALCLGGVFSLLFFFVIKKNNFKFKIEKINLLLLSLQLYLMLLELFRGDFQNASLRILTYLILFALMAIDFPSWINSFEELQIAVKTFLFSGIIFSIFTSIQLFYKPDAIIWQSRLLGTTGSAQHAAVLLELLILPCFWLALISKKIESITFWYITLSILVLFLIWTGSRTGILMIIVGLFAYLRKHLAGLIWVIILSSLLLIVASIFPNISEAINHILNIEDTRSVAWTSLYNKFAEHPYFGSSIEELSYSESSYLLIAARGGMIAFILEVVIVIITLKKSYIKTNLKMIDRKEQHLSEIIFACFCAYFTGALFEGYLISNLAFPIFAFYFLTAILQSIEKLNQPKVRI